MVLPIGWPNCNIEYGPESGVARLSLRSNRIPGEVNLGFTWTSYSSSLINILLKHCSKDIPVKSLSDPDEDSWSARSTKEKGKG